MHPTGEWVAQQARNLLMELGDRECTNRMLVAGERHLRLILGEYADHYNSHRPHRSLQQEPPTERAHPPAEVTGMRVLRRDRLGGLIHEYSQVAYGDSIFGTHTHSGRRPSRISPRMT